MTARLAAALIVALIVGLSWNTTEQAQGVASYTYDAASATISPAPSLPLEYRYGASGGTEFRQDGAANTARWKRGPERRILAAEGGASATGDGIVYLRTDATGGLKPYVGQAKNMDRFIERQGEHAADHPNAVFNFEILERNIPASDLDRYEQFYINGYGGPTLPSGRFIGELSNARNQMSWLRYMLAGGPAGIG